MSLFLCTETSKGSFFHFTEIIMYGNDAAKAAVAVSCLLRLMRQQRSKEVPNTNIEKQYQFTKS